MDSGAQRSTIVLSAFLLGASALAGTLSAAENGHPAAKATAKTGNIALVSGPTVSGQEEGAWATVLSNTIKTSSQKDLLIGVSLECGLFTDTTVKSKGGTKDTSKAEAMVQVRVLVDGRPAEPGNVVFARRMQQLSATFQGLIDGALSVDPLTGQVVIDETLLEPEEVQLILETMDAQAFQFVLDDVGTGVHTVEVQARIDLGASAQEGQAVAKATVGKGCLTVEEVRLIKGEDITF